MNDYAKIPEATQWRVCLQGGWTLHPLALLDKGPSTHWDPGITTKRWVFASPEFQLEEPALFTQLTLACARPNSQWIILPTIDTFVAQKAKASCKGANCVAVVSRREATDPAYRAVAHVLDKDCFLALIRKQDMLRGSVGLCGM